MVKEVSRFETFDGKEFDAEYDAWQHELQTLLAKYADNDAVAAKIIRGFNDDRPKTYSTLAYIAAGLLKSMPKVDDIPAEPTVIPDPEFHNASHGGLIRCMGGKFCDHQPGTCTAKPPLPAN